MSHPKCISGKIKLKKFNKYIYDFIPRKYDKGSGYWGLSLKSVKSNKYFLNSYVRFSLDRPFFHLMIFNPFIKKIVFSSLNIFRSKKNKYIIDYVPTQLLEQDYNFIINLLQKIMKFYIQTI